MYMLLAWVQLTTSSKIMPGRWQLEVGPRSGQDTSG